VKQSPADAFACTYVPVQALIAIHKWGDPI